MENSALQAGATNRIRLIPENFGGERRNRTPILSERWFSGPVADHSARALRIGADGGSRTRRTELLELVRMPFRHVRKIYGGPGEGRTLIPKDRFLRAARLPIFRHRPVVKELTKWLSANLSRDPSAGGG